MPDGSPRGADVGDTHTHTHTHTRRRKMAELRRWTTVNDRWSNMHSFVTHVSTMWLIVRTIVAVPGVRVPGATFDDGKGLASKSRDPGSGVVERIGTSTPRQRPRGLTAHSFITLREEG